MKEAERANYRTGEYTPLEALYLQAEVERGVPPYRNFTGLVRRICRTGHHMRWLDKYSPDEIRHLGKRITGNRDRLLIASDYQSAENRISGPLVLPQERFMLIAMASVQSERENRLQKAEEVYWLLSGRYAVLSKETEKSFSRSLPALQQHSVQKKVSLLDVSALPLLSSYAEEKHLDVPEHFMEQAAACGPWLMFHMEEFRQIFGLSIQMDSPQFHEAVAHPSVGYKKISAIGLMKMILESEGTVLHFEDGSVCGSSAVQISIQLAEVMRDQVLPSVCSALVHLLKGLETARHDSEAETIFEISGWGAYLSDQHISLISNQAAERIHSISEYINRRITAGCRSERFAVPKRVAAAGKACAEVSADLYSQSALIELAAAEGIYTDYGSAFHLRRPASLENTDLLKLLMKARQCGIPEVHLM